jgi:hypothetical protein
MNCETCGAQIFAGQKFCTECGTPVTEAPLFTACAACGASNPVGAKFCGDCGRAFEPAAASARTSLDATSYEVESNRQTPDAQRRQLTVQFCDLVGSTELSTRLDPEDLRDVINAYHRSVADTVARFDGYIAAATPIIVVIRSITGHKRCPGGAIAWGGDGAACRGKVGRNKANILTSCLRPRDADHTR